MHCTTKQYNTRQEMMHCNAVKKVWVFPIRPPPVHGSNHSPPHIITTTGKGTWQTTDRGQTGVALLLMLHFNHWQRLPVLAGRRSMILWSHIHGFTVHNDVPLMTMKTLPTHW